MKFLVDAQLPLRLATNLTRLGHDAIHTASLKSANRTPDAELIEFAKAQQRVVVTKDADFVTNFLLRGPPPKLLLISTGNITNEALSRLFLANLDAIVAALSKNDFVELRRHSVIVHM